MPDDGRHDSTCLPPRKITHYRGGYPAYSERSNAATSDDFRKLTLDEVARWGSCPKMQSFAIEPRQVNLVHDTILFIFSMPTGQRMRVIALICDPCLSGVFFQQIITVKRSGRMQRVYHPD